MSRACHVSRPTCHMSHVILFSSFFQTKWWSLSVKGLFSMGPTLSSFNRPGICGAVLKTICWLINLLIELVSESSFVKRSLNPCLSQTVNAKEQLSHVTYHVPCDMQGCIILFLYFFHNQLSYKTDNLKYFKMHQKYLYYMYFMCYDKYTKLYQLNIALLHCNTHQKITMT